MSCHRCSGVGTGLKCSERGKLKSWDTSRWFEAAINRWLHLAKEKAIARVDLSCRLDKKIEAPKTEVQQSTSHVDVCYTLQQALEFWDRIDTGDPRKNAALTEQLVSILCKVNRATTPHRHYHPHHPHHSAVRTVSALSITPITTLLEHRSLLPYPLKL